jgi:carbon monoxide dehydrogenase subunit G
MRLEGRYLFEARPETVWKTIIDPNVIAKCIPGLEKFVPVGENRYEAVIKAGVGAIKGTFTGNVLITAQLPPRQYKLIVEGKSTIGFAKGEGIVTLEAQPDGTTLVVCSGDTQLGGTIAVVGQRVIGATAQMLLDQFFEAMRKQLSQ